ncbi:MAG: ATP-dependent sacrificial sulfur transferase LarE [Methanobacteriaceae archaeon]|jgi:uncharacterized protein|nr:ATP-dependent sacrificial sulfur transferase LarE [Methanobacteriaceae archaeon]
MIDKIKNVEKQLQDKKVAIAFSGGADSTLIAYIAKKVTKDHLAITINNSIMPTDFINDSKEIADYLNINQVVIKDDFYDYSEFLENKSNKCYLCRKRMYEHITKVAKDNGFNTVIDGTNISDLLDNRPGILINYKNNIVSPFVNAKLESFEIHNYLRENNIPYLKASTCLGTRIEVNKPINKDNIKIIQKSEDFIKSNTNAEIVKVRKKDKTAICELDNIDDIINKRTLIVDYLKSLGFKKIYLNLSEIEEDNPIKLDYIGNDFNYQLPYNINLNATFNVLKENNISLNNLKLFENGEIKGENFKNENEAKEEFINILPVIRRNL